MKIMSAVDIAKKIGVKCGKNCRFLDNPCKMFGTEPWLIKIGNHVELTNGCRLVTHDGSVWCYRNESEFSNIDYFAPISIGNNVFVGINTIILPGVKIGDNVIVGANSVVTKDLESNCVYCGMPAKKIKTFTEFRAKVNSDNAFYTKGMSIDEKRKFVMEARPEWF